MRACEAATGPESASPGRGSSATVRPIKVTAAKTEPTKTAIPAKNRSDINTPYGQRIEEWVGLRPWLFGEISANRYESPN
jgi:hypothetical protein